MKGKVYKMVVKPVMLEVVEVKMLRFFLGVMKMDRTRNEHIRGTCAHEMFWKVRETRLRWFGHVQRGDSEYISRRTMRLDLPGRRSRGRPKRRFM